MNPIPTINRKGTADQRRSPAVQVPILMIASALCGTLAAASRGHTDGPLDVLFQQIDRHREEHDVLHQERDVPLHRRKSTRGFVPTVWHERNDRDCSDEGCD